MHAVIKSDLDSLLPGTATVDGTNRRAALKVALGMGYAATAEPIMAQTAIKTPDTGLVTGTPVFEVENYSVPFFMPHPWAKRTCRLCW